MNLRRNLQRYINLYNYVEAYKTNDFSENYTELEYIESDGTQYIRTNINATKNTKIKLVAQPKSTGSTNALIGSNIDGAAPSLSIVASGQFFWGNGYVNFSSNTNKHVYYIDTNKLYVDDELTATSSNSWDNTKIIPSLGLLVVDQGSSVLANYIASAKVYSLQVWNNNNLVLNLIPAKRNSDSVVGMYDKVSNTFFKNDGTGTFIAGPELHPVEYINMTAGSYLLTDIIPTYDGHYEIDIQTTNIATSAVTYLGARTGSGTNNSLRFAHITNGTFRIYGFGSYTDSSDTVNANTRYNFVWNNNVATLISNGKVIYNDTFSNNQTVNVPLAINGWNTDGTVAGNIEGIYCYGFKAWDNQGNLIADYVPMVKDTTPGMYDRVTNTFKEAIVGEFIAGPELSDDSLVLQDAIKDSLKSLKAYGKTELKPDTLLDTVVANGGTEILSHDYMDSITAKGGCEQRNLPTEYTQVNYVTNIAQTMINTGVKFDFSKNYEIELKASGVTGSWYILQARENISTPISGVSGSTTGNKIGLNFNGAYVAASQISRVVGHIYYIKGTINNGNMTLYVKDETAGTEETVTGTYTPITGQSVDTGLFGNTGGNYVAIDSNVYFARIKEDDNYIMDYVPCRQGTTVGFYDKVSGTFKTTTGLSAGADIIPTPDNPVDIYCNNGVLKARHQSGLPLGYTLLDGIVLDGSSYVDTGLTSFSNDSVYECDFVTPAALGTRFVFGQNPSSGSAQVGFFITSTSFNWQYGAGSRLMPSVSANTAYSIVAENGKLTINGTTYTSTASESITINQHLFVGTGVAPSANPNQNIPDARMFIGTIKRFKYTLAGVVICDLVPVKRNSDNVLGFYDTVRNTFLTNAGTGDFTAGNSVSDPVEVYTDGITETIYKYGKNLFNEKWNKDTGTSTQSSTWGQVVTASGWSTSELIPVVAGEKYTVSYSTNIDRQYVFYYNVDGTMQQNYNDTFDRTLTVTIPTSCTHIRMQCHKSGTALDSVQTQLEVGSNATTYEPYTHDAETATCENLLSVGSYEDTHDVISGTVTRKIGIKVLNGTETWTPYNGGVYFALGGGSTLPETTVAYCSHFDYNGAGTLIINLPNNKFTIATNGNCSFKSDKTSTRDEWKQWLKDQYDAGTPVIIVYPLSTATTETVDKQRMHKGTVSITEASMTGLTVDTTESVHTIPSPDFPLDLYCNNGKLSLLDGYTRLDYIQSSGTQWIDTGITNENCNTYAVRTKYSYTSLTANSLCGNFEELTGKASFGQIYINGGSGSTSSVYSGIGNKNKCTVSSITTNTDYIDEFSVDCVNGTITRRFNGSIYFDNGLDFTTRSTVSCALFGCFRTNNTGATQRGSEKIYYFQIYKDGKLVIDLIPAKRNSDNVIGMYDLVSNQFFTNQGTGTFTAGNSVILPVSIGTPESLTVAGKNLFDKNGNLLHGTYNATNGSWIDNESFRTLDYIPGKPGVSYTLSAQSTSVTGGNAFSVQAWDSTHTNWLGTVASTTAQNVQYASGISPAGTAYLSVSFAPIYRDIDTLQLEEGTRPTQYENYMNINCSVEDLLSIGNYQDIEDLKAGITNRKVGIKVLNGTENWYVPSSGNWALKVGQPAPYLAQNVPQIICSHLKAIAWTTTDTAPSIGLSGNASGDIGINPAALSAVGATDTTTWKKYLADQYAAGTPVIVVYPLATETTESTITQSVDIVSGTNTVERNSEYFDSLGTEVNYKKLR